MGQAERRARLVVPWWYWPVRPTPERTWRMDDYRARRAREAIRAFYAVAGLAARPVHR